MSFIKHFDNLEDTRSHINKKHELLDIIFLTVVAILSGAEGWKDIKQFGDSKLEWLRKFRDFEAGIPVDDTIARIISAIEPTALLSCFMSWVNEIRESNGQSIIAFDGKTLRHSFDGDRKTALHSVSAYAVEQGLVLAQCKSLSKKNEVSTVMELIELLELKGNVITADAMHCLKKVTKAIDKKDGDYALQVKNNQGKLSNEIKAYFHKIRRDEPQLIDSNTLELTNDGHGRIEHRQYVQLPVTDWLSQREGWSKLNSVIEVTRKRYINEAESSETAYYISSLEIDLPRIAKVIRSHWAIENSSHWVLDVTFKEDESRIRRGDAPENMATFRRFAMNLARLSSIKDSIKGKLKRAAWSDDVRE
ncbi:ISAs1 family transposase [Colwellia sp. RSH04]|uniref:ISAs1 family transposase n=1 Tax=Colwellia sp. RSH04 TaxID=2305464 RepID=UPI000E58BCA4|nr:ISAs1 family transposase [Colwellia sp. RSH04]RHW75308.1 ISAs1 family transposase [Colwellia sp. RSH04]